MAGRGTSLTMPAWMSGAAPGGLGGTPTKQLALPATAANPPKPVSEWQEFSTPDGRKYFYNKITKQTTWEKPDDLKSSEELAAKSCPWKEYTSDSGRKYYYNHITHTSSWETPAELIAIKEAAEAKGVDSPKVVSMGDQAITKSAVSYSNKKDAAKAFKDMLAAVGVRSNWSWETALSQIASQPEYGALTSLGDKKQAFAEYCQQRKKYEEEDRRKKERQVKDDFVEMLRGSKELNSRLSWRKAQPLFENDARYIAVDDKERELLFEEYLYELEKSERDEEQKVRKDNMVKFKTQLESNPTITVRTQWRKLKETLTEDPLFTTMDKLDALTVFDNHIRDLERKEAELQRTDRDRNRRESRKSRDAFRVLLTERFDAGEIGLKTKWREFVKNINTDPRYTAMFTSTGSTPQELFSDFLEDFEEILEKDKRILREILKEIDYKFTLNTTLEDFLSTLTAHERYVTMNAKHVKHLYEDQMDKAEEKEKGNLKRKKKQLSAFKDVMKGEKGISPTSTWIDARPLLMGYKEFDAIDDEQEREKAFNEYIAHITKKQKDKAERKEREKEKDREKEREKERDRDRRRRDTSDDEPEEGEERDDKKRHHKDKKDKDKKKKKHRKDDDDKKKKRRSPSDDERSPPKKQRKERAGSEEGEVKGDEKEEGETDQESPVKSRSSDPKMADD